jgi:predicted transcriptional regulator
VIATPADADATLCPVSIRAEGLRTGPSVRHMRGRISQGDRAVLVREVVEDLRGERPLAYTTVMTVMENLHRKGWLRRERDGRAWRYEPTGSRSGYTAALMTDALATSPDRRTALAHFVLQMSPHDAAVLREALGQARPESEEG